MKKVLIIAYYWPPAGGPGVQRWLKFVKYLPEFGYHPFVYIPENPTYPIIDESLLDEVSKNVSIIKGKIFEPYGILSFFDKGKANKISSGIIPAEKKQRFIEKVALWIRGNVFIPDARVFWVRPSVKFLDRFLKQNGIDTIITTGPPHSLHLIGLKLKKKSNIRWIADFRDPWTTIGYHHLMKLSVFSEQQHKHLEHKVLNSADQIIVTSKSTKEEFRQITTKPICVITNGYDKGLDVTVDLDSKFSISHIGSLMAGRNPKILWESLSELMKEIPDFEKNFQLKLIGA
ncbi:MAG TPA: glycosyltransferase, partial [Flavobacterium sp.]